MEKELMGKLHNYIRVNNPDLLLQLEEENKLTEYLSRKVTSAIALMKHLDNEPAYIFKDACLELLTQELRPSKYNYILDILEEEFPEKYTHLLTTGTLKFEAINIINHCLPVFEELHFSEENEDNNFLRFAITGAIGNYMERNK